MAAFGWIGSICTDLACPRKKQMQVPIRITVDHNRIFCILRIKTTEKWGKGNRKLEELKVKWNGEKGVEPGFCWLTTSRPLPVRKRITSVLASQWKDESSPNERSFAPYIVLHTMFLLTSCRRWVQIRVALTFLVMLSSRVKTVCLWPYSVLIFLPRF